MFSGAKPAPKRRNVIEYDALDRIALRNYEFDSPRFHDSMSRAPQIAAVREPEPIDFANANTEEIEAWSQQVREAREAKKNAPPYAPWREAVEDLFYVAHAIDDPQIAEDIDPEVEHHTHVLGRVMAAPETHESRQWTADNGVMSALWTLEFTDTLEELIQDDMAEAAERSQNLTDNREQAESAQEMLERLRQRARDHKAEGEPIPDELVEEIKQKVHEKRAAQQKYADAAEQPAPGIDHDTAMKIDQALANAKAMVDQAKDIPGFCPEGGLMDGPGVNIPPEQALSIADEWTNNQLLRRIAASYGRMHKDMRYKRARRVQGGIEEIVDVQYGDDIPNLLPQEMVLLADDDLELEFLRALMGRELLQYEKIGEENTGRGDIGIIVDESSSMFPDRIVFAKALALTLLNIARKEKRGFFCVSFSSSRQTQTWLFPKNVAVDAEAVLDMCRHAFKGGTQPLAAIERAAEVMLTDKMFSKADLVMLTDGEANYGTEDAAARGALEGRGVRIHGIGIGDSFGYLDSMCTEKPIAVHEFELDDPNAATNSLAANIT